ncbi:hypothetical protein [Deinococcus metallilatus]|uniref:Uncharacterized protein n=1 Tax=Deinococcus metallilatus TaxID=1211322 RepID=A0ABR6MSN3_9DEIO|nr:hypothetical protein [Deinococcus metallilatus]MBB5294938.1 hypothetical protein [Deinococcus metallilatus]GMA16868.1 hypothetical protein GCM10025871_31990 [Deinococcus metallilatus]
MPHPTAVRRALPLLLGLFLMLSVPWSTPTQPMLAGDDTKIGTGGG